MGFPHLSLKNLLVGFVKTQFIRFFSLLCGSGRSDPDQGFSIALLLLSCAGKHLASTPAMSGRLHCPRETTGVRHPVWDPAPGRVPSPALQGLDPLMTPGPLFCKSPVLGLWVVSVVSFSELEVGAKPKAFSCPR